MNLQFLIIRRLLYFDIFKHPLKLSELLHFLPSKIKQEDIEEALKSMVSEELVEINEEEFINVDDDLTKNESRKKYNKNAELVMDTARKRGKFISKFPFIEGVFISGSLSKGVMQEDGDIDFFMITLPKRLWLSRAFLVFYKRIFLFNSRKEFCINYFKTTNSLEIEDQNLFTAIELGTILPVVGEEVFENLIQKNIWIEEYVSGFINKNQSFDKVRKPSLLTKVIEWIFDAKLGDTLDEYILNYTVKRNRRKYHKLADKKQFDQMFRSNQETAKVHPNDHQHKVLTLLEEKERVFKKQKNILI